MPKEIDGKTYYLTSEACEVAGISRQALFRWIRDGFIEDVELRDRNGWRLFTEEEIQKLKAETNRTSKRK